MAQTVPVEARCSVPRYPADKPCSGKVRRFLWNGQPGDHEISSCEAHMVHVSYWYRNAVEIPDEEPCHS